MCLQPHAQLHHHRPHAHGSQRRPAARVSARRSIHASQITHARATIHGGARASAPPPLAARPRARNRVTRAAAREDYPENRTDRECAPSRRTHGRNQATILQNARMSGGRSLARARRCIRTTMPLTARSGAFSARSGCSSARSNRSGGGGARYDEMDLYFKEFGLADGVTRGVAARVDSVRCGDALTKRWRLRGAVAAQFKAPPSSRPCRLARHKDTRPPR